ncbi:hypothetical protein [Streptomyces sp. WZ-12]|uniref:hypothetical protein n=1 Tax=Streptomyces sp. WZ-12 TaxID=3030210 RepID=UPI002381631F|nr:hypothetical protein [Streptomyces sp. WZ-12]
MNTATVVITIGSIIATKSCALLSLWMRLRWRVRREQARHQYVVGVAEAVANGARLKLEERCGRECCFRMEITHGSTDREDRAA